MSARSVHLTIVPAAGERIEIVRYEPAGTWWVEDGQRRQRLTLDEAVAYAEDRPSVIWHEGLPGGRTFDARVRTLRQTP